MRIIRTGFARTSGARWELPTEYVFVTRVVDGHEGRDSHDGHGAEQSLITSPPQSQVAGQPPLWSARAIHGAEPASTMRLPCPVTDGAHEYARLRDTQFHRLCIHRMGWEPERTG